MGKPESCPSEGKCANLAGIKLDLAKVINAKLEGLKKHKFASNQSTINFCQGEINKLMTKEK